MIGRFGVRAGTDSTGDVTYERMGALWYEGRGISTQASQTANNYNNSVWIGLNLRKYNSTYTDGGTVKPLSIKTKILIKY